MKMKVHLKKLIKRIDQFSPYPVFYPFIMSESEIAVFDEEIKRSKNYLEFGLGGSSLRAIQKSNAKIYTVESSAEWLASMRRYLAIRYHENRRLNIFLMDIGATGDWGYPKSESNLEVFEMYSSKIFDLIDKTLIDLVLIDGRFRVACTLNLIMECYENDNLKILIHDFWNREKYHIVLKYLEPIRRVDTLGLFSIVDDVDIESVKLDYEIYKLNPD